MDTDTRTILDRFKEYALSDADIREFEPNTNIFTYPYLNEVSHIDEVLDRNGRAIMLFLTENEQTGHWLAIMKRGKTIEVYDSYGKKPDSAEFISNLGAGKDDMERFGQSEKLLTDLIRDSGYKLEWNKNAVQPGSKGVNTCGRHAVMRLMLGHLPLREYNALLGRIKSKTGIGADDLATALTADVIGK